MAQGIRASRGDVDLTHWQGICKLRQEYGGDIINGWVAKLFPYLREYSDGPAECLAVRPKVGWAVRPADKFDVLLARLTAEDKANSGPRPQTGETTWPRDLVKFYHHTDGAKLFGNKEDLACRFVSFLDIQPLDSTVVRRGGGG